MLEFTMPDAASRFPRRLAWSVGGVPVLGRQIMITDISRLDATMHRLEYRNGWLHRGTPDDDATILISTRVSPDDVVDTVTWFIDGTAKAKRTTLGAEVLQISGPVDDVVEAVLGWPL